MKILLSVVSALILGFLLGCAKPDQTNSSTGGIPLKGANSPVSATQTHWCKTTGTDGLNQAYGVYYELTTYSDGSIGIRCEPGTGSENTARGIICPNAFEVSFQTQSALGAWQIQSVQFDFNQTNGPDCFVE